MNSKPYVCKRGSLWRVRYGGKSYPFGSWFSAIKASKTIATGTHNYGSTPERPASITADYLDALAREPRGFA